MSEQISNKKGITSEENTNREEKMNAESKNSPSNNVQSANISESSSSNGEEYEIVQMAQSGELKKDSDTSTSVDTRTRRLF